MVQTQELERLEEVSKSPAFERFKTQVCNKDFLESNNITLEEANEGFLKVILMKSEDLLNEKYGEGGYSIELLTDVSTALFLLKYKSNALNHSINILKTSLKSSTEPEKFYLHLPYSVDDLEGLSRSEEELFFSVCESVERYLFQQHLPEIEQRGDLQSIKERKGHIYRNVSLSTEQKIEYREEYTLIGEEISRRALKSDVIRRKAILNKIDTEIEINSLEIVKTSIKLTFGEESKEFTALTKTFEKGDIVDPSFFEFVDDASLVLGKQKILKEFYEETSADFNIGFFESEVGFQTESFLYFNGDGEAVTFLDYISKSEGKERERRTVDVFNRFGLSEDERRDFEFYIFAYELADTAIAKPKVEKGSLSFLSHRKTDLITAVFGIYLQHKDNEEITDEHIKRSMNEIIGSIKTEKDLDSLLYETTSILYMPFLTKTDRDNLKAYLKPIDTAKTNAKNFLLEQNMNPEYANFEDALLGASFLYLIEEKRREMGEVSIIGMFKSVVLSGASESFLEYTFLNTEENFNAYIYSKYFDSLLAAAKDILPEEAYTEMHSLFLGTDEAKKEKFLQIFKRAIAVLKNMGITAEDENFEAGFHAAFAFYALEEALHEEGADVFRKTEEATNERIVRSIVGFDYHGDLDAKTSLAIYYYNRRGRSQTDETAAHNLELAFYANMMIELKIEIGEYMSPECDCYDPPTALEVFWFYGFMVESKDEMQAVFNYIFSDIKSDKELKNSKELFLKVIVRNINYFDSLYPSKYNEKGEEILSVSKESCRLWPLYFIVNSSDDFKYIRKQLKKREPSEKISFKYITEDGKAIDFDTMKFTDEQGNVKLGREILNESRTTEWVGRKEFKNHAIWWWVSTTTYQLPIDFYTGEGYSKLGERTLGGDKPNSFGIGIGPGTEIRSPSWRRETGTHNFMLAYDKNGEIKIIEFTEIGKGVMNHLDVELKKKSFKPTDGGTIEDGENIEIRNIGGPRYGGAVVQTE